MIASILYANEILYFMPMKSKYTIKSPRAFPPSSPAPAMALQLGFGSLIHTLKT